MGLCFFGGCSINGSFLVSNKLINNKNIKSNQILKGIPEFKMDWCQYPMIDIDKLQRKPLKDVGKIFYPKVDTSFIKGNSQFEHPSGRILSRLVGKYLVWNRYSEGTLSCIDTENKKFLWITSGYLFNGTDNSIIKKNKSIICDSEMTPVQDKLRYITAIDLATGKENWRYIRKEWNLHEPIVPEIVICDEETIILKSRYLEYAILIGIDAITGKQLWEYPGKIQESGDGIEFIKDKLIFTDLTGSLTAINQRSGQIVWKKEKADWKYGFKFSQTVFSISDQRILMKLFLDDTNHISSSLLHIDTGKIVNQEIQFLKPNENLKLKGAQCLFFSSDKPVGFFVLSLQNAFYLSKVDLNEMKEEWRIPIGKWNQTDENYFFEIELDKTVPDYFFFLWFGNLLESNNIGIMNDPNKLPNGLFEINTSDGKILWWCKTANYVKDGIVTIIEEERNVDKYINRRGRLELKTGKVLSAYSEICSDWLGEQTSNFNIEPNIAINRIQRGRPDIATYSYYERNRETGELIAYYPDLEKDGFLDFGIESNCRFFALKDHSGILLMEP